MLGMRPLWRVAAFVTALGAVVAHTRGARAAPSARLLYVRGPGAERCPSELAVRAAVSARLGYDPFLDWARETLFVEIDRTPRAFHVVVKRVDAQNRQRGAREISVRGDDCSAVIDAMGLSISLTIDPNPPNPAPPAPAAAEPAPRSEPAPAPVVVVTRQAAMPEAAARSRLSLRAGVGAIASLNVAPSTTAGATVSVGAQWRWLSLDLEGRADAPATGDSDVPSVGVRSWLLAGALVP